MATMCIAHTRRRDASGQESWGNSKITSTKIPYQTSCSKGVKFKIFHVRFVGHVDMNAG
jgi:hypothetical protein